MPLTKPIKISFISRAGVKVRMPKGEMTKPVKISFMSNVPAKREER